MWDRETTKDLACCAALATAALQTLVRTIKVAVAAYEAAPPRVRHLALHARKPRTRKKNLRRIAREYLKEASKN